MIYGSKRDNFILLVLTHIWDLPNTQIGLGVYIYEASGVLKSNLGIPLRGCIKVVFLLVILKEVGEVSGNVEQI